MNWFDTPWIVALALIAFLLLLSVREFVFARQIPRHMPDRGIGFFHAVMLCFFAVALAYGTQVLYIHAEALAKIVPLYPLARYAPEREAFEEKGIWVFISADASSTISQYYKDTAEQLGYHFSSGDDGKFERIYLSRGTAHIFLTILDEGKVRVLYYSEAGEVRTITVPRPRS